MIEDEKERAEARVGQTLNDKWVLEGLLGLGGMAAVYSARHRNGARAAIKLLHSELAESPDLRARFLREGYAANRVEHPDAVKVLDDDTIESGSGEGLPFLVMELLEGESLEAHLARGERLGERTFLEIADAVLGVLEAAHEKGIVHRDLKPENILLLARQEGEPLRIKVLDFGIARMMEGQGNTIHGMPLGTPAFMSPEQAAGRLEEIDGRTDLFALGATGFRLLTGRDAHVGTSMIDMLSKTAHEQVVPIRSVLPSISEATAKIVDRALRRERDERYPNAKEMRADVLAVLHPPKPVPVKSVAVEEAPTSAGSGCLGKLLLMVLVLGGLSILAKVLVDARHDSLMLPRLTADANGTDATLVVDAAADVAPTLSVTWEFDADVDASSEEEDDAGISVDASSILNELGAMLDSSVPRPHPVPTQTHKPPYHPPPRPHRH